MAYKVIDPSIVVEDSHFEYLKLQKGRLHEVSHDRARWHIAYEHDLMTTYQEIAPHLPETCWGFLDIGSGLGGIDILISRFYGPKTFVNLLDGENDPPEMRKHRETFNDMRVAKDFHIKNGTRADRFGYISTSTEFVTKPYDLVVSFGSWCFHYEPDVYLPLLFRGSGLHADSVVIVDVRRDRADYAQQLRKKFDLVAVVRSSAKFTRCVYKVRS